MSCSSPQALLEKAILTYMPMEILAAVLSGISILLLICNVLGNVLVVLVIYRNKKLHNANTLLLSNLAWSDLCFAIIVFINMTLLSYALEQYLLNDQFILRALTSIYTLVAVAVERYFAIMKPFVHMRKAGKSLVYKIMTGIWVLACVLTAPAFVVTNSYSVTSTERRTTATVELVLISIRN